MPTFFEKIQQQVAEQKLKPPRKKGGRPKKDMVELQNIRLNFKLNYQDYTRLEQEAKLAGLSIGKLAKKICLTKGKIVAENQALTNEQMELARQLIKVAANINQAVKALNSYQYEREEIESIKSIYNRLMDFIKILQKN